MSIGNLKSIYPLVFAIVTASFMNLSLLHLKMMMVSFRGTYWLSSAYFILLRVSRFFLFLSLFLFFVEPTTC